MKHFFLNYKIDKQELKRLLSWFVQKYGSGKTTRFADTLKYVGFHYAMQAGISIGLDDLQIPKLKYNLVENANYDIDVSNLFYNRGEITAVEKFRKAIDTWAWTSENVKKEVIRNFETHYPLNTVYMMASSGARGNMAQVRQLVGMRGLMSDPKGDLLELAIQTNFREGLTVVEYIISCYGARKGVVDTALRTANSGYLTRRLIEVAQEIGIYTLDCKTNGFIPMMSLSKTKIDFNFVRLKSKSSFNFIQTEDLISLEKRLVGRVLAKNIDSDCISKNTDITPFLAQILSTLYSVIYIRSPFICKTFNNDICQFCYGWGLADLKLVSIGEAVGVLAAQSIGEPGTQLTMRTFHTGGVFSKTVGEKLVASSPGYVFFSKTSGKILRTRKGESLFLNFTPFEIALVEKDSTFFYIPAFSLVYISPGQYCNISQVISESISQFKQEKETSYVDTLQILASHSGQIYFDDLYLLMYNSDSIRPMAFCHGSLSIIGGEIFVFPNIFFIGDFLTRSLYYQFFLKFEDVELRFSSFNRKTGEKKDLFLSPRTYLYASINNFEDDLNVDKTTVNWIPQTVILAQIGDSLSIGQTLTSSFTNDSIETDRSGFIFQVTKASKGYTLFMREFTSYAVSKGARVYVENKSLISAGHLLFLLQYTREKTGDIVQGLPKIEQLFEARQNKGFEILVKNPKNLALAWFFSLRSKGVELNKATLISLQVMKYFILNAIQRVYHTQGVSIADKHIELIIKEMCSIVLIIDGGFTAFVPGELVNHQYVSRYNTVETKPALYIPLILGITKLGLVDESFLSAASFQQTRKVLMAAALYGKRDTLDAMKQSIMIGKLIPVGAANTYILKNYIESIRKPYLDKFKKKFFSKKLFETLLEKSSQNDIILKPKEVKNKKDLTKKELNENLLSLTEFTKKKRGPYKKKSQGIQIQSDKII
jgi:hypothetical protein